MSVRVLSDPARHLLYQIYQLCKTEIGDSYDPEFRYWKNRASKECFTGIKFSDFIDKDRFIHGEVKDVLAIFESAVEELDYRSCISIEGQSIWHWFKNGMSTKNLPLTEFKRVLEEFGSKQRPGHNVYLAQQLQEYICEAYPALAETKIYITNWGVMCRRPDRSAAALAEDIESVP